MRVEFRHYGRQTVEGVVEHGIAEQMRLLDRVFVDFRVLGPADGPGRLAPVDPPPPRVRAIERIAGRYQEAV